MTVLGFPSLGTMSDPLMATRWKSSGLSLSKHANYKDGAGSRDQPNKGGPAAWVKENRHVDKLGHKKYETLEGGLLK